MATVPAPSQPAARALPPLQSGDRLAAEEFERRYDAMPDLKKAELIEGVVYVGSPVSEDHATPHFNFVSWLGAYAFHTPGVRGSDNGSVRLDPQNMPQPDAHLRILESHGGQSRSGDDGYVTGGPELAAEVAVTQVNYDLGAKMMVYQRHGVCEYVVWRVWDREIDWFVLRAGAYARLAPDAAGVYRSEVFPGLWLDAAALLADDLATVAHVLQQGLATPEHAAFVARLQQAAAGRATP